MGLRPVSGIPGPELEPVGIRRGRQQYLVLWRPPGSSDRTNQLLLNPIISYHFADGWSVGSSPNITANWIASGGKWTVPVGGGFSKVIRLGEQPIKLGFDAYYNAIRPTAGNDTWLLQATMTFIF